MGSHLDGPPRCRRVVDRVNHPDCVQAVGVAAGLDHDRHFARIFLLIVQTAISPITPLRLRIRLGIAGSAKMMKAFAHPLGDKISPTGALEVRVLRQFDGYDRAETAF